MIDINIGQRMIRKTVLLLVAVLAVSATFGTFRFDFEKAHIDRETHRDALVLPCTGGSGDYEFEFKGLAKGWSAEENRVYIPKESVAEEKYYGVKVKAFDRVYRQFIKKSCIFSIKGEEVVEVVETDYEADVSTNEKCEKIVREKKSREQKPTPFVEFPELTEVEGYINKGDVAYLRKVIDDVLGSGKQCKLIADYLTQFLSLVQARLTVLKNNAEAAKQDLVLIQEELDFLKKELQDRRAESVNAVSLKKKLEAFRFKIEQLANENSDAEALIAAQAETVRVSEEEIYAIKVDKIAGANGVIEAASAQIIQIDSEIKDLQERISFLQIDRKQHVKEREDAKTIVAEAEVRIAFLTKAIAQGQAQIRKYQAKIEDNLITIRNLESRIVEIQAEIDAGIDTEKAISELELKIKEVSARFSERKDTLAEIEKSIQAIDVHSKIFEKTVNKHFYSCHKLVDDKEVGKPDEKPVQDKNTDDNAQADAETETDDDKVVIARKDSFAKYLKNIYGKTPSQNIRSKSSSDDYIRVKHCNIFSASWTKVYGVPFSAEYGNNVDLEETKFSCDAEEDDEVDVLEGKIIRVEKNVVEIKEKLGNECKIKLGGCTRIETTTEKQIPEVGDNVFIKAKLKKQGEKKEYDGHQLTCY